MPTDCRRFLSVDKRNAFQICRGSTARFNPRSVARPHHAAPAPTKLEQRRRARARRRFTMGVDGGAVAATTDNSSRPPPNAAALIAKSRDDRRASIDLKSGNKRRSRFVVLGASVVFIMATRACELSFNFTVICMTSGLPPPSNETTPVVADVPLVIEPQRLSAIFAGVGIGALIAVFPIVYAVQRWSSRVVFTTLLVLSALATTSMGPLSRFSTLTLVAARIVQGFALASNLPLMGVIGAYAASPNELGLFMTCLTAASQLAQIVSMPLSSALCVASGDSSVYAVHGALAIAAALFFYARYRDLPAQNRRLSGEEPEKIEKQARPLSTKSIPYSKIFKCGPVWAVWIAFVGNASAFQLIAQFMPIFLNRVMRLNITHTGLAAILPPLSQILVKFGAVFINNKITFLSERLKLQLFNSVAMIGCGVCFLPLGYLEAGRASHQALALVCFTASISFLGVIACGSMKSIAQVAHIYAHFVMAVIQVVVCMTALIVPYAVAVLAPDNTVEQWRVVFFLICIVLCATNAVFCFICSAKAQSFDAPAQQLPSSLRSSSSPLKPAAADARLL